MTDELLPPEDDALFRALAALPAPQPPPGIVAEFHVRARPARRSTWFVPAAIAALLCLATSAGWWREHRLRTREQLAMHEQLATALQNISASARLDAIAVAVREHRSGAGVEQALITALLTDQNTSVRIAAANALAQVARPGTLAPALRRALAVETSPFVQLELLRAAGRLMDGERTGTVNTLLARHGIDPVVRTEAAAQVDATPREDSR